MVKETKTNQGRPMAENPCNLNNHHEVGLTMATQKYLPVHLGGLPGFQLPCEVHTAVEVP